MRVLVTLIVLTLAVPDRQDPTPKQAALPQDQLLGDWVCESVDTSKGRGQPTPSNGNLVFRVTPTETIFIVNGQTSAGDGLTATYSINWMKNPVAIEFRPRQRGGTMPGILKIEGDRMTLGLRTSGATPLSDFASADLVARYRRVKK